MATQQEVIKAFMKSLDTSTSSGETALDNAVKACSNFESIQDAIDQLIADCQSAESAESFLFKKCGIIIGNDDTGAITGADAGGSSIKTAESIVPEDGDASYPSGTSFTKRGLKVIVPKKSTLTDAQQIVVQGLYSWWIDEALKLIEESYGYSFTDKEATVKKITLTFSEEPNSTTLAYVVPGLSSKNNSPFKAESLTLTVNMTWFENLSAADVNGTGEQGSFYLDRVLAHELTHAIMAAKINDYHELPHFIAEGVAELIHGIDDERAASIRRLVNNPATFKSYLDVEADPSDDANILHYSAGYIFLRYLAKQASDDKTKTVIAGTAKNDSLNVGNIGGVKIYGYGGKDTIVSGGDRTKIYGGNGNDYIHNDFGDGVTVSGGKGNDTVYNEGGHDVLLNLGDGNNSVNNLWGHGSTILGGKGNCFIYNNAARNVLVSLGAGNDTVYVGGENNLIGTGAGKDFIYLFGSAENSTVNPGKGNDTVRVNAANSSNVFIYAKGDGKDIIDGFAAGDTLNITSGKITDSGVSGNDVVLKIGTGSVTLKDTKDTAIIVKGSDGELTFLNNDDIAVNGTSKRDTLTVGNKVDATLNAGAGNDKLSNYGFKSSVGGEGGKDFIENYGSLSTINGGNGNDTIKNISGSKNLLLGGAGNDSITNLRAGDITINGGKGNDTINAVFSDVIQYSEGDGKDVVFYAATDTDDGTRHVQILSGTIGGSLVSGNDIILGAGNGSLTLKDCKNKEILITDADGELTKRICRIVEGTSKKDSLTVSDDYTKLYAYAGNDSVSVEFSKNVTVDGGSGKDYIYSFAPSSSLYGGAGNDTIVNSGRFLYNSEGKNRYFGDNCTLAGGAGNDSLFNSGCDEVLVLGGAGNDTLVNRGGDKVTLGGGKGNDSLWGDSDSDIFIYESGNDVIFGFDDNDTLTLDSLNFKSSYSKKNGSVSLKFASGSVTLKDFTASTFHINDATYKISGSKFKKQ